MLIDALNRTLLLMRTDLVETVTDEMLLEALTATTVVLSADAAALFAHSGQSAFVTAALLMARSGHDVWLDAPNVPLLDAQPPVGSGTLLEALSEVGEDLLPDVRFQIGRPARQATLAVIFAGSAEVTAAEQTIVLDATDWSATLSPQPDKNGAWSGTEWPVGGLAAATLAAGEAFKAAMRKLRSHARSTPMFDDLYAPAAQAAVELAPADTPRASGLGAFDIISGGAIANALLHVLLRIPGLTGTGRVIDDDASALSNLNRNALLRRSRLDAPKVEDLASYAGTLELTPLVHRYGSGEAEDPELADVVLVGVDHIPSRWAAQRARPAWLGIGATERFSVQVSVHEPGSACAQCLHPDDAPIDGPIPTAAFVSYWAGLILAVALLRRAAAGRREADEQQSFFPALRPEAWRWAHSHVPKRDGCPTCAALET